MREAIEKRLDRMVGLGKRRVALVEIKCVEKDVTFAARRLNLGYRRARLLADCSLGRADDIVLGHEFHYASTLAMHEAPLVACSDASGTMLEERGARRGSVSGTFFHAIDSEKLRP